MTDIAIITTPPAERAALALNSTQTERDLIALAVKNADITVIKNKAGRDQAHGAAMEIKRARLAIEKTAKEARDDATKFSKAVIAEEKRLIGIIEPEETRLLVLRNSWDAEQERIRLEQEAAEQRRIDSINSAIDSIRAIPGGLINCSSTAILASIGNLEQIQISEDDYQEFTEKARHFHAESLAALRNLLDAATQREAEAKRMAEERARLAEESARLEAEQKAEAARIAAERAELERLRAEHEAQILAEQKRIRAAEDAAAAAAEEFRRQAKAERDKLDAEIRAHQEAVQRRAAEAEEQSNPSATVDSEPAVEAPAVEVKTVSEAVPATEEAPIPDALDLILTIAEQHGIDAATARDWLIHRASDIATIEL